MPHKIQPKGHIMKSLYVFLTLTFGMATLFGADAHAHHDHHNHHAQDSAQTESGKIIEAMHAPMHAQKPSSTKSVEIDFLSDMIPHHQGAIDSANLLLQKVKSGKTATLAQNIIKAQEGEIAEFKELIANKSVTTTKISSKEYKGFAEKNAKAMGMMMHRMAIKESGNVERDFLAAMIAHHQGAIDTSTIVLEYTKDEKVRQIAQKIIDDQQNEITTMQKLIDTIDKKKRK